MKGLRKLHQSMQALSEGSPISMGILRSASILSGSATQSVVVWWSLLTKSISITADIKRRIPN